MNTICSRCGSEGDGRPVPVADGRERILCTACIQRDKQKAYEEEYGRPRRSPKQPPPTVKQKRGKTRPVFRPMGGR